MVIRFPHSESGDFISVSSIRLSFFNNAYVLEALEYRAYIFFQKQTNKQRKKKGS